MAILRISDELIKKEPTLLDVLTSYFETFEEMTREHVDSRRFNVKKDGIPPDNTGIILNLRVNKDHQIEVFGYELI